MLYTPINFDTLRKIRSLLREGGDTRYFFKPLYGSFGHKAPASQTVFLDEVEPGKEWGALYSAPSRSANINSPHHLSIQTEDRQAWWKYRDAIEEILQQDPELSISEDTSWRWESDGEGGSHLIRVFKIKAYTSQTPGFRGERIAVCASKDPRAGTDLFRLVRTLGLDVLDGSYNETKEGFEFSCYDKEICAALRKHFSDCHIREWSEGRGPGTCYNLACRFPDMGDFPEKH